MYILQNDHHSKLITTVSLITIRHYTVTIFFSLLMKTFKILSNVQIGNKYFPFLT